MLFSPFQYGSIKTTFYSLAGWMDYLLSVYHPQTKGCYTTQNNGKQQHQSMKFEHCYLRNIASEISLDRMWIFGYGSLVWKVDFKYERKLVGYIRGYLRRFYQHSIDHRGVPEKPGRVVTLIPSNDPTSEVWGVAYKIKEQDIDEVTEHLDFREKNGYSKKTVTFYPKDMEEPFELTLYVATEENESYAGPASMPDLAKQIVSSHGPSGPNKEYIYNLASAMRQLAPQVKDDHLFELEAAVKSTDPDISS